MGRVSRTVFAVANANENSLLGAYQFQMTLNQLTRLLDQVQGNAFPYVISLLLTGVFL